MVVNGTPTPKCSGERKDHEYSSFNFRHDPNYGPWAERDNPFTIKIGADVVQSRKCRYCTYEIPLKGGEQANDPKVFCAFCNSGTRRVDHKEPSFKAHALLGLKRIWPGTRRFVKEVRRCRKVVGKEKCGRYFYILS